jgi:hypothetical protein
MTDLVVDICVRTVCNGPTIGFPWVATDRGRTFRGALRRGMARASAAEPVVIDAALAAPSAGNGSIFTGRRSSLSIAI